MALRRLSRNPLWRKGSPPRIKAARREVETGSPTGSELEIEMSEKEYHLGELEIARTPNDPRHVLPMLPDQYQSILDIGCGAGQTLIACGLKPERFFCGVDVDEEALALGRLLSQNILFVRAQGERLPFADHSFDVVISRVSLPLMHIPKALSEIARVLRPGGYVWFTLHPFSIVAGRIGKAVRTGNVKSLIFQFYIIANSLFLHLIGKQFRYPINRNRCESFQFTGAITKAMRQAGFEQVRTERNRFFIVTATKES